MQEPGIHAGRTPPPSRWRRPLSRRGRARLPVPLRVGLTALALLLAGGSAGCAGEPTTEEVGALTPEAFVEVIVALREAERDAVVEDSAPQLFQARKEAILAEHGVTEEDVRDFVRLHEGDFALMDMLWDTIAQRLKYVPEAEEPPLNLRIEQRR